MACDYELDTCIPDGEGNEQVEQRHNSHITHAKRINSSLTVAGTAIPLRVRTRDFHLSAQQGWQKNNYYKVDTLHQGMVDCWVDNSLYELSVSENSIVIDGDIYILDTEHNNAFWRETRSICTFSGTSKDVTGFTHPSWISNKLRINDVHYDVTTTWYLMINGEVEALYTESYVEPASPNPLFFVYTVPTAGLPSDPDFQSKESGGHGYTFLYWDSGEWEPSGGEDYYYPRYLWDQGIYREQDAADAVERYWDITGVTALHNTVQRGLGRPLVHGPESARGSIVVDADGNTFASVMVTKGNASKLWFNRLNGVEPTIELANTALTFNGQSVTNNGIPINFVLLARSYYPVGLMSIAQEVENNG